MSKPAEIIQLIQTGKASKKAIAENENITLFYGDAFFEHDKVVKINHELLSAELIFINVGARAFVPQEYQSVSDLTNENILVGARAFVPQEYQSVSDLTNENILELPEHLVVIGGSYIGLEVGQIFRGFGSEVTIIEGGNHLISREDEDTIVAIEDICESQGTDLVLNAECIFAEKYADQIVTVNN